MAVPRNRTHGVLVSMAAKVTRAPAVRARAAGQHHAGRARLGERSGGRGAEPGEQEDQDAAPEQVAGVQQLGGERRSQ